MYLAPLGTGNTKFVSEMAIKNGKQQQVIKLAHGIRVPSAKLFVRTIPETVGRQTQHGVLYDNHQPGRMYRIFQRELCSLETFLSFYPFLKVRHSSPF